MTDKEQFENKKEAVEMTIEEFLTIRKEAGLKIDPETAEVDGYMQRSSILMGSIRTCRMKLPALGERTSLALRTVTFGSSSATYPRQPETRCGKSTNGG